MQNKSYSRGFRQIVPSYGFQPFGQLLHPLIEEAFHETGQHVVRKGTVLLPAFLVYAILALTLRRDRNTQAVVIQWMVSSTRW